MKKRQANGAVLYVRVSTDEQAGPQNLMNQEKKCRSYCAQNGFPVVQVFVDLGESARTADRPEFQKMLDFCKANRQKVGYVVVQDLSRFTRNLQDQAATIYALGLNGIMLRSTYEANIDESAAGVLAANIYGAFHQYFSDSLSEKMKDRTRQAVSAGRFPWRAPLGYINIGGKDGPNIKPDSERAALITRAFQLVATGRYKKADVLRIVTDEGLKTARGKSLTPQTFQALLKNPLYAGWVTLPSDESFLPVKGLHEPIVSQELFDRVQDVLAGRKPSGTPKRKYNPELPLKCLIRCGVCETPITGGFVKGRSKKYGHYWCRKCHAVKSTKETLESEFVTHLQRLRPTKRTSADFPKIAAKVWAARQGDTEKQLNRLSVRLEDEKRRRRAILDAMLARTISPERFKEEDEESCASISVIEEEIRTVNAARGTMDAFVRFAELQVMDIAAAWQIAGPEQRQRVQNLLFQDGLNYVPGAGILNRSNSSLFSILESTLSKDGMLASPTGFEPVLSP